jgi:N-methylhydantoinase A/oxoprolinase/acetone carboxylase beta subunit
VLVAAAGAGPADETVRAYSFAADEWADFAVLRRELLAPGEQIQGPAILLEETATAYIDHGFAGRVHDTGSILLTAEARR